jgi:stringent starvation protein B
MKPTAATTTTRGQVHDGASTEVAVQTVSSVKSSEVGGGGTVEVEKTAQGVASEEEEAEEEAALEGGSVKASRDVAHKNDEEAEEDVTLESGSVKASRGVATV